MPTSNKKTSNKKRKKWKIKDLDNKMMEMFPVFEVNEKDENVETRYLEMKFMDENQEHRFVFNYLDIFMFMYFCSNEELRRTLSLREEATRSVNYIPYEVTFKLDDKEKRKGVAKRRIEVPMDALTVAIARNEAFKSKFTRNIMKGRK